MWVIGHGGKWRKCSYGKDSASENSWCLSSKQREYYPLLSTISDEWIKATIPASTSGWSTSQIIVLSMKCSEFRAGRDGDKAPQCFVQLIVILLTQCSKNISLTYLIQPLPAVRSAQEWCLELVWDLMEPALITDSYVHSSCRHYNWQPSSSGLELLSDCLINKPVSPVAQLKEPRCLSQIVFSTGEFQWK